jgi:hypothetical protein
MARRIRRPATGQPAGAGVIVTGSSRRSPSSVTSTTVGGSVLKSKWSASPA